MSRRSIAFPGEMRKRWINRPLQIVAVRISDGDEYSNISAVCYVDPGTGKPEIVSNEEAINMLIAGSRFMVLTNEGAVDVIAVRNRKTGERYLRSTNAGSLRDDLLRLPRFV